MEGVHRSPLTGLVQQLLRMGAKVFAIVAEVALAANGVDPSDDERNPEALDDPVSIAICETGGDTLVVSCSFSRGLVGRCFAGRVGLHKLSGGKGVGSTWFAGSSVHTAENADCSYECHESNLSKWKEMEPPTTGGSESLVVIRRNPFSHGPFQQLPEGCKSRPPGKRSWRGE